MKLVRIFERFCDDFNYRTFKMQIQNQLSYDNLDVLTKHDIKKLFNIKTVQEFIRYRFELLKQWMIENEAYHLVYVSKLLDTINKLYLTNELNAYEKEYIKHYQGVVFAKTRNIKKLVVDFSLVKNESAYYRYENCNLYDFSDGTLKLIQSQGEMYITSQKILLSKGMDIYPIELDNIVNYKISKYGFLIFTNQKTYALKTYDDYVLYVSFERVLRYCRRQI